MQCFVERSMAALVEELMSVFVFLDHLVTRI